jgi:hypothetical protein
MDVPLAMYHDEIDAYKEAMCCEYADSSTDSDLPSSTDPSKHTP